MAESYVGVANPNAGPESSTSSTLCGAVVRADRVTDGLSFETCTVGGTDASAAIVRLWDRIDRADVRVLFVAGVAPAWFNLVDLARVHGAVDRPVLAVSFEDSPGLAPAIREAFDGRALDERLATYRALPPRTRVRLDDDGHGPVFVRAVGCDDDRAAEIVRAFTPEGGRPEPLRVARLGARAADEFRRR